MMAHTYIKTYKHKTFLQPIYSWTNKQNKNRAPLPQFQTLQVLLGFQPHLVHPVVRQMSVSGQINIHPHTWRAPKFRSSI